ncbi:hypothetical protein FACS189416_4580 [Bacteroidia bacterium]|nr:hypothetical protein FACS189416_4580 [Bacteroidia bacterium]
MKRIIHRELLNIFSHTESAEDDAKDIALGEFADELQSYCRQEKDLAERTRTLRFARSELAVAQERIHTGAGKKCAVAGYCNPSYWVNRLRTGNRQNGTGTS